MAGNDRRVTEAEWRAEGRALFGEDTAKWKFVCPSCGHVTSVEEWKKAGATDGEVAYNCIGRRTGERHVTEKKAFKKAGGPCNYTGGGLFKLNPVTVVLADGSGEDTCFEFAR